MGTRQPAAGGALGRRWRAIADRTAEASVDGLLVSAPANVRYLSGFTGSSGWLLLTPGERPLLVTDGRYREQASAECAECDVRIAERGIVRALLSAVGQGLCIGFDSRHLAYAVVSELKEGSGGASWKPLPGLVERLRERKEPDERARQERSLALAEGVLREVVAEARPGVTEVRLAAELEYRCRLAGATAMAFETIVAGGAHGARPHARPRAVPLPSGEPVVVDLGCVLDGYCSDLTRCVVVGELGERWQRVHAAVSDARRAAISAIGPGVKAADVDAAARSCLAEEGLEEAFVHSLGHGVGLEVHEPPRLAATSSDVLEEGMIVTVEPGVYLEGQGGIRLEDMVVVTESGATILNGLSDEPLSIGGA